MINLNDMRALKIKNNNHKLKLSIDNIIISVLGFILYMLFKLHFKNLIW